MQSLPTPVKPPPQQAESAGAIAIQATGREGIGLLLLGIPSQGSDFDTTCVLEFSSPLQPGGSHGRGVVRADSAVTSLRSKSPQERRSPESSLVSTTPISTILASAPSNQRFRRNGFLKPRGCRIGDSVKRQTGGQQPAADGSIEPSGRTCSPVIVARPTSLAAIRVVPIRQGITSTCPTCRLTPPFSEL